MCYYIGNIKHQKNTEKVCAGIIIFRGDLKIVGLIFLISNGVYYK